MMRPSASWVVGCIVATAPMHAQADEDPPALPAESSVSRALPITLIAVGAPSVVYGVIGIAFNEEPSPKIGPRYWATGTPSTIVATAGAAFTAAGTYLYLRYSDGRDAGSSRRWMKWSGLASISASVIGTGLGIKFGIDRRHTDREIYDDCFPNRCTRAAFESLSEERDSAERRSIVAFSVGGALAVGGVALLLASREGTDNGTRIDIGSAGATVGWSTKF